MNGYWRFANVLLLLIALCGCAHDALLREETQKFVEVARKSEAAGTAFYDGIIAKDREIWVFLHRVDPDCKPEPIGISYSQDSGGPLNFCRAPKPDETDFPLEGINRDKFGSRYAALQFIDTYLVALAKVSEDPKLDASENFKSAASKLNLLLDVLKEENVSDARVGAVADLALMLEQLSMDRESAKAIRAIAVKDSQRIDANFTQLIVWLDRDEATKIAQNRLFEGILSQVSDSNQNVGLEARRMWMENRFQKIDSEQKIAQCKSDASAETIDGTSFSQQSLCGRTAAGAMLAGWQAHKGFVSLIGGNMSKKQKARLLSLQRQNFFKILKLYVDFTGVF